ncbi:DNA primase, partial [Salmonella enterica subsp. enterica serovar Typhi]|nr:DNA primase [Salmonella enterica subsp. enterica serovar Typhi]
TLELTHADLRKLLSGLVDALAHGVDHERGALIAALSQAGLGEIWGRAVEQLKKAYHWPALEDAAFDDARDTFLQVLHLHRSARNLNRELKQAETAMGSDPTEENYRHFLEVQAQLQDVQATEALIEGYGVSSGRVGKS